MVHQRDGPSEAGAVTLRFAPDVRGHLGEIDLQHLLEALVLLFHLFQHDQPAPDQLQLVVAQRLGPALGKLQLHRGRQDRRLLDGSVHIVQRGRWLQCQVVVFAIRLVPVRPAGMGVEREFGEQIMYDHLLLLVAIT